MDYRELIEKLYEKSEEIARLRASLLYLKYLYDGAEDKSLVLDEKQFRTIMDIAGIKVEKEIQLFCDNCSDAYYES